MCPVDCNNWLDATLLAWSAAKKWLHDTAFKGKIPITAQGLHLHGTVKLLADCKMAIVNLFKLLLYWNNCAWVEKSLGFMMINLSATWMN